MNKIKKILFLGHNKWAVLSLEALINAGYKIVGVITETDEFDIREKNIYGRFSRFNAYDSLKENARKLGCRVYQPVNINDPSFLEKIKKLKPDIAVIVSYHGILKKDFLEIVKVINIHGAPLPKYRGRSPINWSIVNGETYTGITAHHVITRVDAGKIIEQKLIPIFFKDRAIDVLLRSLPIYPELVLSSIRKIEDNPECGHEQDESGSIYFPKRYPEDGKINWNIEKTIDIYNKIRALSYPYPCAQSYYQNRQIFINSCSIISERRVSPIPGIIIRSNEDGVFITTIDGLIKIKTLIEREEEITASLILKVGKRLT